MEVVRLACLAELPFIPKLAEDEFVEFVEGFGRIQFATAPQGLVRLFEAAREFILANGFEREELLAGLGGAAVLRKLESR